MVLHTRGRVGSRRFFSEAFERNLGGFFRLWECWMHEQMQRVTLANLTCYDCKLNTLTLPTSLASIEF